jgi:hypothetical protein
MMAIRSKKVWPWIVAHADMDAFYAAIRQLWGVGPKTQAPR